MSPYHRSDKEEWDELVEERREARRHHYDPIDNFRVGGSSEFWDAVDEELRDGNSVAVVIDSNDAWFWDDGREEDPELADRYRVSRLRGSRNGNDW